MKGFRALEIERSFLGLSITRIVSSHFCEDGGAFLSRYGFDKNIPIAAGLVPGDFLSAYMNREKHMDDTDMESHLKWEIQQKIISDFSDYNYDFVVSKNAGFMFAGRKMLVNTVRNTFGHVITDVEPVALLNGCEGTGAIENGTCLLISVEAEGISSIVLQDGNPVAMESFPVQLDNYSEKMPGLIFDGSEKDETETAAQLVEYITGSINRLTSRGEDKKKPTPDSLVLTGGGVYLDGLHAELRNKVGIRTSIADPFRSEKVKIAANEPPLECLGAAFTTCFGLALRAIEEQECSK